MKASGTDLAELENRDVGLVHDKLKAAYKDTLRVSLILGMVVFVILGIFFLTWPYIPILSLVPKDIAQVIQSIGGAFLSAAAITIAVRLFVIRHSDRFEDKLQTFLRKQVTDSILRLQEIVNTRFSSVQTAVQDSTTNLEMNIEERTIRLVESASSLDALHRAGISQIYVSRLQAADHMLHAVARASTTEIQLAGISLNDFVRGESPLHRVWEKIERYIEGKELISHPLHINVLPVHPDCIGAALRSCAEHRNGAMMAGRLKKDVDATVDHLLALEHLANQRFDRDSNGPQIKLQARLCTVTPPLFLFRTDTVSFVQQYYFWSARPSLDHNVAPTIRFQGANIDGQLSVHEEMGCHFEWLWKNASVSISDYRRGYNIGTCRGLYTANCINAYNSTSGGAKRIAWLLDNAQREVKLLGISLKSFLTGAFSNSLRRIAESSKISSVKVLIINPLSEGAKQRAFREFLLNPRKQATRISYKEYVDQNRLKESDLWRDTRASLTKVRDNFLGLEKFSIKLYNCAPTCFLLLVDDAALVEQYQLGKALAGADDGFHRVLGKDMPIYEYNKKSRVEVCGSPPIDIYPTEEDEHTADSAGRKPYMLIDDHFEHIWKYQSQDFNPDEHLRREE